MQLLLLHKTIFPQHLQCIDTMKKFFCFIYLTCLMLPTSAQGILSLDSCRALAVANNKELLISREKINAAHYRKKEAFTNYLPKISATGGYMRNQKEFSLLNDAQKGALGSVGTQVSGALQNGIQGMMTQYPQLAQNPQFMALVQSLGNIDIATPLNGLGQSLVDAFRTDTRNMYAGALTLTQPLYMGGKIRAYNKITRYAEELARQQHNSGMQEVILSTDQAYWQVVSLANKKKLAEGYLELLQKLESDIDKMIAEGVATKADGLSVKVKVNEAEMTLTKVNDGLSLSRMLLCQLCGLDLSTPVTLADEQEDDPRYKIMIMWLPEKMKEECANRLLKMIEEPYENTVLLFVSNKPNEILPTIYSRIQRVGMKRLSDSLVAECLTQSLAVDSQTAMSFAALSEGSVTKAMGLMDSAADNAMFLDMFKQLTRMAYLRDVRGLKVWSEEAADMKREKNVLFLTYLSRLFRENFIYNIGNRSLNYLTPQEEQFSAKFCPFVNERNVEAIENETARAASDIARNANAKIVMFDYAVKMVVALRM